MHSTGTSEGFFAYRTYRAAVSCICSLGMRNKVTVPNGVRTASGWICCNSKVLLNGRVDARHSDCGGDGVL
jgi:hypothetical protein